METAKPTSMKRSRDFWETAGGNFEWAWGTHFDKDDNIYVILTLDEGRSTPTNKRLQGLVSPS